MTSPELKQTGEGKLDPYTKNKGRTPKAGDQLASLVNRHRNEALTGLIS